MTRVKCKTESYRVFVDLDDTLLPFDTVFPVWKSMLKRRLFPILSKDLFINGLKNLPKKLMVSCFTGMELIEYEEIFVDLANRFHKDIDLSVVQWAEGLVSEKSKIHIVTGSLLPLAKGISIKLGWGECIGTKAEIKNSILTGRLDGFPVKGKEKILAIKKKFQINDNEFRDCSAAGDSFGDRYLMEICGQRFFPPNTSRRLKKHFERFC